MMCTEAEQIIAVHCLEFKMLIALMMKDFQKNILVAFGTSQI